MTFLLRIELIHDRQSKRAAQQIGQAIGTEYPISSVNRLGFMVHLLRGDGLYPFLEEFAGLRPAAESIVSGWVEALSKDDRVRTKVLPVWSFSLSKSRIEPNGNCHSKAGKSS
ncbi:hypothetical protein AOQ71_34450 [Bradyrhizobium manausense]|uniref:Uncharacterized protein n=1 Tax=Bradyrhizobium manausense TaxID=989370 RepID=A0A0R3CZA3_9BRAD|nr:hypothetical protein AOQ71_34450 [Bradyrhizobium manausense]